MSPAVYNGLERNTPLHKLVWCDWERGEGGSDQQLFDMTGPLTHREGTLGVSIFTTTLKASFLAMFPPRRYLGGTSLGEEKRREEAGSAGRQGRTEQVYDDSPFPL